MFELRCSEFELDCSEPTNPDVQPISIIITTLAARAYRGEADLGEAMEQISGQMGELVRPEAPRVPNPGLYEARRLWHRAGVCTARRKGTCHARIGFNGPDSDPEGYPIRAVARLASWRLLCAGTS